jgi:mannose-6-phosphate isomerase-like protein (cupin superfamily)
MDAFELDELLAAGRAADERYHEFLRVPAMSAGVYLLPDGGTDPQTPHAEDELYLVLSGEASIAVGEQRRRPRPGSVVFVAAGVPHRFHDIRGELAVLVLFAPAESGP